MDKKQIQDELKHEFLALAFCKNSYQTKLVEDNIAKLYKMLKQ